MSKPNGRSTNDNGNGADDDDERSPRSPYVTDEHVARMREMSATWQRMLAKLRRQRNGKANGGGKHGTPA